MTLQQMIQSVSDNLGNRSSGRIGSRPVEDVILEAINLAVPHCVLEATPDYYNRTCVLELLPEYDESERDYALPTHDTDMAEIRIKNIMGHRATKDDGTYVSMRQVTYQEFVSLTKDFDQDIVRDPTIFSLWGKDNRLHIDSRPPELIGLTLFVETYPIPLTNAMLEQQLPLDPQWDIVVEAFATAHCYLKLQQTQMYAVWTDLYNKQKASISRDEYVKHGKNIESGISNGYSQDPTFDPFVHSWS